MIGKLIQVNFSMVIPVEVWYSPGHDKIVGFRLVDNAHTATTISERKLFVLSDYELGNYVIAVTLDNTSTNYV